MFRFAQPQYLYLLLIVPLMWAIYFYSVYRNRKNMAKYGNPQILQSLAPDVSKYKPGTKFFLQQLALIVMIFIIARPQMGAKIETVKKQGVEIIIALDVSNSMLARDIAPSRLDKAKQMLSKLIDQLDNDKVGLIVFAGDAYTQLPITSDFVSAKMFLSTISPDMVPTQGTAIGRAIALAMNSFTPDQSADKAIIVITDAENHEDDAVQMAKEAAQKGIMVDVIGIGSEQGAPIPIGGNDTNLRKDNQGNVVITKLNAQLGRDIAKAGDGIYISADNTGSALRALTAEVKKMKKSDIESKVYSEYDEQFQGLAWIVLILLLLDIFILDRKNKLMKKVNFFS
ncbi:MULTISPECIES: vWA domain-containing protein [Bacteroidales]|uniref:Membrane protein n=1 Tax=Coprobacter secundus subsp. similis TaxID=2751153 RepID=A0A7G1HUJ1_9BACT|nr:MULTISPECIES: VWA domain-containing protein [Bacteroidales]BCI62432.1 membrane protein [Coprobacter secundus subsp. similis]